MGTTVTPNLGLIKPDGDEKIKEDLPTFPGWASQNEDNCDTIDSLFKATNTTYTVNWTGSGSNPVLGAGGFTEGKYIRLFPRMVVGHFRILTGGAGFTVGSGAYRLNLPVAPDADLLTFDDSFPIGKAVLLDVDTIANNTNLVVMYQISSGLAILRPPAGNFWSPTDPITLAQNDRLSGYFIYPTSVV